MSDNDRVSAPYIDGKDCDREFRYVLATNYDELERAYDQRVRERDQAVETRDVALREVATLKHGIDIAREGERKANASYAAFREHVRDAFAEYVDNGTLDRSDANETLASLGLTKLAASYTAEITVTVEVQFATADEDAIINELEELDLDATYYGDALEDFEVNATRVTNVDFEADE